MKRILALPIVVAALLAAPRAARAQGADLAAAQGLFDEAKQLVAAGKLVEACPKFLASFKLDPKPGTAVNLADCFEKTGRTASAWARYLEAASLAQRAGQVEREQYAKDHAARLEPSVSRLGVAAPSAPPGLEVLRDGAVLDPAILGTAVPVDPGKHVIEARAPGKKAWSRTVDVAAGAARVTVEIPALEDGPAGEPARPAVSSGDAPQSGEPPAGSSRRKPVGLALIGVGGAGVVVGAVTGGLALGKHGALASACPMAHDCLGQSSTIASYHLLGTVADVGLILGGALAVTGIALVATAPKASATRDAWVVPVVGPGFVGAKGSF